MYDPPPAIAFYFTVEERYGQMHFECTPVALDGLSIRNLDSNHALSGLVAWTTVNTYQGERVTYGPNADYRDVPRINLAKARDITATLKAIQAGLERIKRTQGYYANMGQYVLRLARILGIKQIVVRTDTKWQAASYGAMTFAQYDLVDGSAMINQRIDAYVESGNRAAALVA